VENGGKRSIVEGSGTSTQPVANDSNSCIPAPVKFVAEVQTQSDGTRKMWNTNDPDLWQNALNRYWTFVKASNLELEKEMDQLDAETV
jgi:hypothetical protein